MGFCRFVFNEGPEYGTYLHNLYVSPKYQGRGVAKTLLRHAIEVFDGERRTMPCHLLVFAENSNAVVLYEKLGGTVIENKRDGSRWGNDRIEQLRYQWPSAEALRQKMNHQPSQTS